MEYVIYSSQLTVPPWIQGVVQVVSMGHQPVQRQLILKQLSKYNFNIVQMKKHVSQGPACSHHGSIRRVIVSMKPAWQRAGWKDREAGSLVMHSYLQLKSHLNKTYLYVFLIHEPTHSFSLLFKPGGVRLSIICEQSILTDIDTRVEKLLVCYIPPYRIVLWQPGLCFQLLSASLRVLSLVQTEKHFALIFSVFFSIIFRCLLSF